MNHEQGALVGRLKEAGVSLKRFLKVGEDKAAFEMDWDEHLYTPDSLDECPRWGICGREGLVLIDADNSEMAAIIRRILPKTFETISPRRQLPHFYYKVDGGVVENRTLHCEGDTKGAGEIRAQNHYVVAPGTEIKYIDLASGEEKTGRYTILEDRPIAEVRWTDFINAVAPYLGADVNQKITWEQMREGVPQGTRHAQGIKYATFLVGALNLDPETALHQMDIWNGKNRPPMAEHDLKRMVQKAIEYAARERPDRPKEEIQDKRETYFKDKAFIGKWLADDISKKNHFITHRDSHVVWVYTNGVYKPLGEEVIREEARWLLGDFSKKERVSEAVCHIRETTYTPPELFEPPLHLINVQNGVLNIETGKVVAHSPETIFINELPVDYDPKAECPNIMKFLSEILHSDDVPVVQEIVGYCLLRDYRFAKAVMLLGGGANAKSTLLSLVIALLGQDNIATPSLHDLTSNRFSQHELYGKLANVHADLPAKKISYTGNFKMLTGQDLVRGEQKHKDSFSFLNYAKLLYSANELPGVEDTSEAFWRRWIVIDFPNIFPEGDPKTDPNIMEKLTTPEELSGFLNWALAGLHRLMKNKKFTTTKSMEEIEEQWVMQTDSLRAFAMKHIVMSTNRWIPKDDFFDAYQSFCSENEVTPYEKALVGRKLPVIMPTVKAIRPRLDDKRYRAWKGIWLSKDYEKYILVKIDDVVQSRLDHVDQPSSEAIFDEKTRKEENEKGRDGLGVHMVHDKITYGEEKNIYKKESKKSMDQADHPSITPIYLDQKVDQRPNIMDQREIKTRKEPKISQQMWLDTFKESWKIFSRLPHSRVQGSDFNVLVVRASEKLNTDKETAARYLEGFVKDKVFPISLPEEKGAK